MNRKESNSLITSKMRALVSGKPYLLVRGFENMVADTHKQTPAKARRYLVGLRKGFHEITPQVKRQIAKEYFIQPGAFDMIRLPKQISLDPIRKLNKDDLEKLTLIEMKSSDLDLDHTLKGYFFSYTYSEQLAAQALGERYQIVFVVLPRGGGKKFYKEMSYGELWSKAMSIHMSWQIRF